MNTGGIYFKEIEFPELDVMPSSWRKLIPENRKFVVGYIGDMKQHMGINDHFWTREALKYLAKYVLLKRMKNIRI